MSGYEGQPDYVRVGFQVDLLGHWCNEEVLPYDEWGRMVTQMWALANETTCLGEDRAEVLLGWLWEELSCWEEEDPGEEWRDWEYGKLRQIRAAQGAYEETVAYWRERAKGFNGSVPGTEAVASDALEEVVAALPYWVKPDPDAEPLPDPEREQYERLRAKFGES